MDKNYNQVNKYNNMDDITLISYVHKGDTFAQDFIINRYKDLVKTKARDYFIVGAATEDIIQEGMIGLYKAVRDFNKNKFVSFYYFAEICITRQIITAIKAATRQKHIPLNSYIPFNIPTNNNEAVLDNILEDKTLTPEEYVIDKESKDYIEQNILETLSEFECKVLSLHLEGKSYIEMAKLFSKNEKSIDNALQRIRKKVEKILANKNLTDLSSYAKI